MKYHDLVCTVNNKKVEENQVKKILTLVLALAMSLSLCACGGKSGGEAPAESEEPDAVASPDGESEGSGIQVDEGLLSVEITIPASFFEEKTEDEIKADAEENGFTGCTVNEDGSVTYKMSKARHREMMDGMKASLWNRYKPVLTGKNQSSTYIKSRIRNVSRSLTSMWTPPHTPPGTVSMSCFSTFPASTTRHLTARTRRILTWS